MEKNLNKIFKISMCVSILLFCATSGCKKKQEAPVVSPQSTVKVPAQAQVQKAVSSATKQPLLQKQISSSGKSEKKASLDFTSRKDPFKPAISEMTQVAKGSGKETIPNMNLLPIQRVEVEKFRITGIIAGLKENRALLVDPDGKAYVMKSGMFIGPNSGKITRITANSVEVDESFKDDAGRMKKRTVKLTLQRKK